MEKPAGAKAERPESRALAGQGPVNHVAGEQAADGLRGRQGRRLVSNLGEL